MLSADSAERLINSFRVEFGAFTDAEDVRVWQGTLRRVGLTDETAGNVYEAFARHWRNDRPPTLSNFRNYCRKNVKRFPTTPKDKCGICGGDGLLEILRMWKKGIPGSRGLEPGEIITEPRSEVYGAYTLCKCSVGDNISQGFPPLSQAALALRDKWFNFYTEQYRLGDKMPKPETCFYQLLAENRKALAGEAPF